MDFGCGFGGFLNHIYNGAKYCCSVDLGRDERSYLNGEGIKCYKTIEEFKENFDVITLFHILGHLVNPVVWLNKFSEYLD